MHKLISTVSLAALFAVFGQPIRAQSIYATLTGVVSDASEAVIPGAKVTITNTASGDVRRTTTNGDGYYTFASLPVGAYKLSVDAAGFTPFELTGMQFTGSEKRNVNVTLKVGVTTEKVEVTGGVDLVAP